MLLFSDMDSSLSHQNTFVIQRERDLAEAKGPEITRKLCEKPVEGASLFTDLALIEGCSRNDIGQLMA
jgi:hypothetical protein